MQNLKFLVHLCFILPFLSSTCGFDVEDNKRTVVTGRLLDQNQNPVPNIQIISQVDNHALGEGKTDINGFFEFVSLESYTSGFVILINQSELSNPAFSKIEIINASGDERSRTYYDVGNLTLYKTANLEITTSNISGNPENLFYQTYYQNTECRYRYEDYNLTFSSCNEFSNHWGSQQQQNFSSIMGSTVNITFTLNNEEQTVNIPLTEENNYYEIEY